MAESPSAEATVSEIAAGVGMLPSTTHRVLSMLENEDLVRQDSNRGRYSLGSGFHRLARSAAVRSSLREVAQPWVDRIRDSTEETAWFATMDSRSLTMMFSASAESPHLLRIVRPLDEVVSIFRAGASGRVALAYLPEADQRRLLQSPEAEGATEQFKDLGHLRAIRERGYEVSASSSTGGMGVAAPVLGRGGRLFGVLGLGLPESRSNPDKEQSMVALVVECATRLADEF